MPEVMLLKEEQNFLQLEVYKLQLEKILEQATDLIKMNM